AAEGPLLAVPGGPARRTHTRWHVASFGGCEADVSPTTKEDRNEVRGFERARARPTSRSRRDRGGGGRGRLRGERHGEAAGEARGREVRDRRVEHAGRQRLARGDDLRGQGAGTRE